MKPPKWHKGHPPRAPGENYHHVWFGERKKDYWTKEERGFKNTIGFVFPMMISHHDELHALVKPPPKPLQVERFECLDFVKQRDSWAHDGNPYWAVEAAMTYFVYRGADKPEHEQRCHDIRWNLAQQIGIMAHGGKIEPVQAELPHTNVIQFPTVENTDPPPLVA